MKVVLVMFDTLNRRYLPPYGSDWVHAPNFQRLADSTVVFEQCYAGSMPCIPARRELHTGRYNFLHRGWGPLEPFDDSVPQILGEHGVHTHLATDHQHYWEDGGATYHNRFTTYEFFRGQEGDAWKGHVAKPDAEPDGKTWTGSLWRQDLINRQYLADEADHPQTLTFDAGLQFIRTNHAEDRWLVQIETFDPHEPFFSYEQHKKLYPHDYDGPHYDWPDYTRVTEDVDTVEHVRAEYAALVSMCDASLGRVLDSMDDLALWDDTMLIVCTDHGFLLGEHGWWGKSVQPWYDETIHTPLFIWDPRSGRRGERRRSLVQTIDIGPTLLDFFGVDRTPDMQGRALRETVADDVAVREAGLFGGFGGHVNVTDGRYVYMRACRAEDNQPLAEYTLMPTHMRARFAVEQLRGATLAEPFEFTKGVRPLRVPGFALSSPYLYGSLLFDLQDDPGQERPLQDDRLELRMIQLMVRLMREADAPVEQYERLGLPQVGPVGPEHLLVRAQWPQLQRSLLPPPRVDDYPRSAWGVATPIRALVSDPVPAEVLLRHLPLLFRPGMLAMLGDTVTLIDLAAGGAGMLPRAKLNELAAELAALPDPPADPATSKGTS